MRCSCTFVHSAPLPSHALAIKKLPSLFCSLLACIPTRYLLIHLFPLESILSKLDNIPSYQSSSLETFSWSSARPISIGQLHTLLHFHLRPIYVIVSHGSYHFWRKSLLVGGFALRCFQRLSLPYVATQLCLWQDNWCTRGMSIPVLSY